MCASRDILLFDIYRAYCEVIQCKKLCGTIVMCPVAPLLPLVCITLRHVE